MEKIGTLFIVGALGAVCFWFSPELRSIIMGGALVGAGEVIASLKGAPQPSMPMAIDVMLSLRNRNRRGFSKIKKIRFNGKRKQV